jgi:hypothetical protein
LSVLKRLLWLTIGATLGFGGSWWVTRTVKAKLERYMPARLTAGVVNAAHSATGDVRAAVADGRDAMHEREAQLRAQLDARFAPRGR